MIQTGIIEKVEVKDLFGQFSYNIPKSGILMNPSIFYGDNGVGKSTLLSLIFHLLSSAPDRGHRGALWRAEFSYLSVTLESGFKLSAERPEGYKDDLIVFSIFEDNKLQAEWSYTGQKSNNLPHRMDPRFTNVMIERMLAERNISPNFFERLEKLEGNSVQLPIDDVKRGEGHYIEILQKCAPTIFFVNAERTLASDTISKVGDEHDGTRMRNEHLYLRMHEVVKDSRQNALKEALGHL